MRYGFTFLEKHTSEFGLTMLTKSRPILPEKRTNTADFPSRDGSVEYAALNEFGRAMYQNRTFTARLHVSAANIEELQERLSDVAVWLSGGKGKLVFDDMPAVQWTAEVKGSIDYVPEVMGRQAILDVAFDVEPFSSGHYAAGESPVLDSSVMLAADVYLSPETLVFTPTTALKSGDNFSFTVQNTGSAPVRPKITVTVAEGCYVGTFDITLGSHTIGFGSGISPNTTVIIDVDEYCATDANGKDFSVSLNGDIWELMPGANNITFTPGTPVNENNQSIDEQTYTITIDYTPKYFYNS